MVSLLSMVLAFTLTWILLPGLNKISGQQLLIDVLLKPRMIALIVLTPIIVGTLSGLYPALFMSSFQPVKVLKGLFSPSGRSISFRKVLVTVQFAISIILIISTGVVFQQLQYMQKKSLGFDRDHIVTLGYYMGLNDKFETFRNELMSTGSIKNVTRSSRIPTGRLLDAMGTSIKKSGDSLVPANVDIKFLNVDQDFISTYAVKMVAGRNFSREYGMDTASFLINEAAVKVLGLKSNQDAIGTDIAYGRRTGKILGVMNDFHFESMHQKISPIIMMNPTPSNGRFGRISIKIAGDNIQGTIAHIEKVWNRFLSGTPFEYKFLDENFDRLYESETRQGKLFTIFAFIAIFIACLGLFGLSAFAISQRIKEIGIRKVLGASTGNIVSLLSKDFLRLVIISAVFAFPIAWYAMNNWLMDFAYRVNIPWWLFLLAGLVACFVALATISFQAIKAAFANPVKNLRTE